LLFEAFYVENKDKLTAVLTRYSRDSEAAADAVQEAFLKALKNRDVVSNMQDKTLWSWLYSTAKNALVDEKRKTSRIEPIDGYDEAAQDADLTDVIMVRELLQGLPPKLMNIVSLRYYGGLNATEISRLKGIPAATVRTQLREAIAIMKKKAGGMEK